MNKTNLANIVSASIAGITFVSIFNQQERFLDHYINKRRIQEKVAQFEQREPQSETMWDYLQGKGDLTVSILMGAGIGVLVYALGKRVDKKKEEESRRNRKELFPEADSIIQRTLGNDPDKEKRY